MKCRVSEFQRHLYNIPISAIVRGTQKKKKKNNDEYWIFASLFLAGFFSKIRLSSAISLLRQFRFPSIHPAAIVPFIRFRKFSYCLVVTRFAGAIAASGGELRDSPPTRRRSLIVAAAKLETAGTRSRWPGLTSRVSRLTMLQFSLSAQSTVTPARNIAHVRRERKTAGQCTNSLPSNARKSLNGCSNCDSAFRSHPLKITDIAIAHFFKFSNDYV